MGGGAPRGHPLPWRGAGKSGFPKGATARSQGDGLGSWSRANGQEDQKVSLCRGDGSGLSTSSVLRIRGQTSWRPIQDFFLDLMTLLSP